MQAIKSIAVIEDDLNICRLLAEEVGSCFPGVELLTFYSGEYALASLKAAPADIALFDIHLPGISGIACIRELKAVHPDMLMMVLTALDDSDTVFEALKAGAVSYLLKSTPGEQVAAAIREVWDGGSPMSRQIERKVIGLLTGLGSQEDQHLGRLSRREKEILEYLSKGFSYKEIALQLFLSLETVRTHIRNIYEKLQVHSRSEALKKVGIR